MESTIYLMPIRTVNDPVGSGGHPPRTVAPCEWHSYLIYIMLYFFLLPRFCVFSFSSLLFDLSSKVFFHIS